MWLFEGFMDPFVAVVSCDNGHGVRNAIYKLILNRSLRESYISAVYTHIHIHVDLCAYLL